MFIWDEGRGHKLTEATYFCLRAAIDSHVDGEGLSDGDENVNRTASSNKNKKATNISSKSVPTNGDQQGEMRKMSQCAVYSLGDDDENDDDDDDNEDIDDCANGGDISKEATCVSIALSASSHSGIIESLTIYIVALSKVGVGWQKSFGST